MLARLVMGLSLLMGPFVTVGLSLGFVTLWTLLWDDPGLSMPSRPLRRLTLWSELTLVGRVLSGKGKPLPSFSPITLTSLSLLSSLFTGSDLKERSLGPCMASP